MSCCEEFPFWLDTNVLISLSLRRPVERAVVDAADYAAYLADRERSEPFDLDAYAADFAARYPQGVES